MMRLQCTCKEDMVLGSRQCTGHWGNGFYWHALCICQVKLTPLSFSFSMSHTHNRYTGSYCVSLWLKGCESRKSCKQTRIRWRWRCIHAIWKCLNLIKIDCADSTVVWLHFIIWKGERKWTDRPTGGNKKKVGVSGEFWDESVWAVTCTQAPQRGHCVHC